MRTTIINRLALVFVIGAILTVMTGSVSAATMPEVLPAASASTFVMGEWDADACPYSSGHSADAKLDLMPATQ